ncbi:MAG: sigma-70 family RNA polymerase sigma factor [Pseudomonadota bacterium]
MSLFRSGRRQFERELVALLPRMRRFGLTLTGNDDVSDDLVQASVERALSRWRQFKPGTRLDRWLFAIMHSTWKNELRSRAIRRGAGFIDPDSLVLDDSPRLIANADLAKTVRRVLMLPEAQRVVVLMVYVEGYSYREASELLEVPIGTITSRLARARIELAQPESSDDSVPQPDSKPSMNLVRD